MLKWTESSYCILRDPSLLSIRSMTDLPCCPLKVYLASLFMPLLIYNWCCSHVSSSQLALGQTWVSWLCLGGVVYAICGDLVPTLALKSPHISVGYCGYMVSSTSCTSCSTISSIKSLSFNDYCGGI